MHTRHTVTITPPTPNWTPSQSTWRGFKEISIGKGYAKSKLFQIVIDANCLAIFKQEFREFLSSVKPYKRYFYE